MHNSNCRQQITKESKLILFIRSGLLIFLCNSIFHFCASGRGESWLQGTCCCCRASGLSSCSHLHCERGVGWLRPLHRHHYRLQTGILHKPWFPLFTKKCGRYLHFDECGDDDVDVFYVIQADNHQENLVVAEVKKLETDGLVNFISINEVRYITEYNQVVGAFLIFLWKHHSASFSPAIYHLKFFFTYLKNYWTHMPTLLLHLSPHYPFPTTSSHNKSMKTQIAGWTGLTHEQ